MQEDYKNFETQALIDLLVQQTTQLTAKIAEKNSVEIHQYEYEISLIQMELNSRKQTNDNTNISGGDITFVSESI